MPPKSGHSKQQQAGIPAHDVRPSSRTVSPIIDVIVDENTKVAPTAMEGLASRSGELIQLMQKLESLGINSALPSLPKFVVVGDQSAGKSSIIEAVCDISTIDDEGHGREQSMEDPGSRASKSRKTLDGRRIPVSTSAQRGRPRRVRRTQVGKDAPRDSVETFFALNEVQKWYEEGLASGLPNQIDPRVTEHIILLSLNSWPKLVGATLQKIQSLLHELLLRSVDESLAARRHTRLYRESIQVVDTIFKDHMIEVKGTIDIVVACETYKPTTNAEERLREQKETEKAFLTKRRLEIRIDEYCAKHDATSGSTTSPEERKSKMNNETWISAHLGIDLFGREIDALATSLAYYEIASGAFIETVAKNLEFTLISKFGEKLKPALLEKLEAGNP